MSNWLDRSVMAAALLAACGGALAQAKAPADFSGIGRAATAKEVQAWDIDVRPDFKGLPPGSGSVNLGMDVWENKCASCHGVFGESNEVFSPLVGGTSAEDVKSGRVARLNDSSFPGRTTLMKVSSVSTLWDYIHRAMPWTNPKSLKPDEVYGVTAYLLNMGGILPDDFVLSDKNIAEVQKRLPNRAGKTTAHGLWPGKEFGGSSKPDVQGSACMKNCPTETKIASFLPEHARDNHGNLAEQQRPVGAQRGVDTRKPGSAVMAPVVATVAAAPAAAGGGGDAAAAWSLAQKNSCVACHGLENKLVGPSFREIAKKHGARADAVAYLAGKIRAGGAGVWGAIPMPPQNLGEADAKIMATWLAGGAAKP